MWEEYCAFRDYDSNAEMYTTEEMAVGVLIIRAISFLFCFFLWAFGVCEGCVLALNGANRTEIHSGNCFAARNAPASTAPVED